MVVLVAHELDWTTRRRSLEGDGNYSFYIDEFATDYIDSSVEVRLTAIESEMLGYGAGTLGDEHGRCVNVREGGLDPEDIKVLFLRALVPGSC